MALDARRKKIASLVVAGVPQAQIASALGLSESYISRELTENKELAEHIEQLKIAESQHTKVIQRKYDNVEHKLLDAIGEQVAYAELRDLTRALEVVAKHNPRARGQVLEALQNAPAAKLEINAPTFVAQQLNVQHNARNEIIEIEGRDMRPRSISDLQQKLKNPLTNNADCDTLAPSTAKEASDEQAKSATEPQDGYHSAKGAEE